MGFTNILSIVILLITTVSLGMLLGGFFPQRWITAEFDLVVNGSSLAKSRPVQVYALVPWNMMERFNKTQFTFHIISKMGLYTNCKDREADIFSNKIIEYSCDGDGAATWQLVAFSMAALSLLFGTVCVVMSAMGAFKKRFRSSIKFRFAILLVNFTTGFLALFPVIMYTANRKIQVKPPLPDVVTFDIGWALLLTLAAAGVSGLVVLLNAFMITVLGQRDGDVEETTHSMKLNSVATNGYVARF